MTNERRTILALVAAGRISAAEAERLLRTWNEPVQWFLAAAVCLALAIAHPHAHVHGAHWLHQLARHALNAGNTAAQLLTAGKEGHV